MRGLTLQRLEADGRIEVLPAVGRQLKAIAADPRYKDAWEFLIEDLCGRHRLSFMPAAPDSTEMMYWREGRRFVGEWLMRLVAAPIPDATPPELPGRTMTQKAERRAARLRE